MSKMYLTFTCVRNPVLDEILEELRRRLTQHMNSVGHQHIAICQQHQQNQHWIHFLGELSFFSLLQNLWSAQIDLRLINFHQNFRDNRAFS